MSSMNKAKNSEIQEIKWYNHNFFHVYETGSLKKTTPCPTDNLLQVISIRGGFNSDIF